MRLAHPTACRPASSMLTSHSSQGNATCILCTCGQSVQCHHHALSPGGGAFNPSALSKAQQSCKKGLRVPREEEGAGGRGANGGYCYCYVGPEDDITDLCAKNDMMPCVSLMGSADITQLDDFNTRHQRGCCPFGQLVGIVLQLCGQNSSSLGF